MSLSAAPPGVPRTSTARRRAVATLGLGLAALAAAAACGLGAGAPGSSGKMAVVAAESFWGSIASQLGGNRVQVRSVIANPDTDPHAYEARPADGRAVASAGYVIVNGAGYDPWAQKLIDANPAEGRRELDVGRLVGVKEGGNPHLWYSPTFVRRVIDRVATDLAQLDPSGASYFAGRRATYESQSLEQYDALRAQIRQRYAGTPVGSTESIFVYLADDLGLEVTTPPAFMDAIGEGGDPTAADRSTFDAQIAGRRIRVLVFNSQNSTPDVRALVGEARSAGIPVTSVTETPSPANLTFQQWQSRQLQALAGALAGAS